MWPHILSSIRPGQWAVLLVAIVLAIAYLPTFQILHEKWAYSTGAYSHGYLVLGLSLFLLAYAARQLRVPFQFSWLGVVGVLAAGFVWMLGYVGNVMLIQATVFPAILFAALISIFGLRSGRLWLFPLAFFLFAVPFWDSVNWILQEMTIAATTAFLAIFGVTAYIDGSFVELPNGTFEIAAGCSGLHFFIVGLALVSLYAYLFLSSFRYRVQLIIIGALFAIVMNWIRVTTIIIAGYMTDMEHYLVTIDHYSFGWVLFTIFLIPLYMIAERFERKEAEQAMRNEVEVPGTPFPTGVVARRALLVAAIAAIAPAAALAIDRAASVAPVPAFEWPQRLGEWTFLGSDVDLGVKFEGAVVSSVARYKKDEVELSIFANLYRRQRQGGELISGNNALYAADMWQTVSQSTVEISAADNPFEVRSMELKGTNSATRVINYWYEVAGNRYTSERRTKLAEVWQTLKGAPSSGLRLISVECQASCERAHEVANNFLSEHGDQLSNVMKPGDSE
jgi:exosortase A